MKFFKIAFATLLCVALTSCSDDDNNQEDLTGQTGEISLKFDNGVAGQDFTIGTTYNKSNDESFKLDVAKYIISNVRLTDSDGNTFEYPSEDNVFIIDEENGNFAGEIFINLENVDAADYTSITFGIGIDQERFLLGEDGQGDFLAVAQDAGMLWSWATGYRFVRFDGTASNPTETDMPFAIHMGSVGTQLDNYREVTLDLPNTIRVRQNLQPEIHIMADLAKVFDGATSVSLTGEFNQVHTSDVTTPIIANNMMGVFSVHHVHNN